MRTLTYSTVTVNYPDQIVWLGDNNCINIVNTNSSSSARIGAKITITNPSTGNRKLLTYMSDLKNITFNISDTLRGLFSSNGSFTIRVDAYTTSDSHVYHTFNFTMNVLNGKSLPSKSHGVERTVYCYDSTEASGLDFFFPTSGRFIWGSHTTVVNAGISNINVSSYVTTEGTYRAQFISDDGIPSTEITSATNETVNSAVLNLTFTEPSGQILSQRAGDVWADTQGAVQPYYLNIERVAICDEFDAIEFRYTNTDGCRRYIAGRIIEQDFSSKQNDYYKSTYNVIYNNIAYAHKVENDNTLVVCFDDIKRNAFLSDIELSTDIEFKNYNGDWIPCILNSKIVKITDSDVQDYELEFTINKQ